MMKRKGLILVSVLASITFAAGSRELTFAQLLAERERLNDKQVCVVGYFDAEEGLLLEKEGSNYNPVSIDLTDAQALRLKKEGILKSGYIRVAGKFQYVGEARVVGSTIIAPAGFRGGGVHMQITSISQFVRVPRPKQ